MHFSWSWLFWPWMAAIGIAAYGFYCLNKHLRGDANVFEQLAIVTSAFTWLTLVPPAHFNGFLEGWPFVFFFVYHYFFFFNVSVRKRLYGDFFPREHDPKWDISLPNWQKLLFSAGVAFGHWIAAFEGPELHLIPGGWSNAEKVVVPTAVVQFGPYRFVRHPIYASTMLLFASYCIALRAPLSSLFTIAVCFMYYGQKAKLEEGVMVETFGGCALGVDGEVGGCTLGVDGEVGGCTFGVDGEIGGCTLGVDGEVGGCTLGVDGDGEVGGCTLGADGEVGGCTLGADGEVGGFTLGADGEVGGCTLGVDGEVGGCTLGGDGEIGGCTFGVDGEVGGCTFGVDGAGAMGS
nr:protein C-terminal S-isoprenylcysteine carboxyl O-methyltransferase [Ipomoea batatas]